MFRIGVSILFSIFLYSDESLAVVWLSDITGDIASAATMEFISNILRDSSQLLLITKGVLFLLKTKEACKL